LLLTIVLAESALELVPVELAHHPQIICDAKRRGKLPEQLLLDRSYHHRAMVRIPNAQRRGRPDIVHIVLLTSLGSPLNLAGRLRVYVHTLENRVITISPEVRMPRNSERFKGLIEQLYEFGRVPPGGQPLLEIRSMDLIQLLKTIAPTYTVGLTLQGEDRRIRSLATFLAKQERPVVIIGGFPSGHFSEETMRLIDEAAKIYSVGLEAWTVTSWFIFAYQQVTGLDASAESLR
jgi:rRNA small subunit pseudouridine methyltransferase Nep1